MNNSSMNNSSMDELLVPFDLVGLLADEAVSPQGRPNTPQGCVAIGKVISNQGHADYAPHKAFFDNMDAAQRVSLCKAVEQEITIRQTLSC